MYPIHFCSWWNVNDGRLSHVGTQQSRKSHGSGRALFGDWGRLGNVYVKSVTNNDVDISFQFNFRCPFIKNYYPFYFKEDFVKETPIYYKNPHLFIKKREETLNKYRHQQQIIDVVKKQNKTNENYVNGVKKRSLLRKKSIKKNKNIPISVKYAAENYSDLLTAEKINEACKTNSAMYSGGCIKTFILNGDIFIARCTGTALDILCIDRYKIERNCLQRVYTHVKNESVLLNECLPIFEIDTIVVNNECRLLIRHSEFLRLFIMKIEDEVISVKDLGIKLENPTLPWVCGRLSTKRENNLATTSSDAITLYDINTNTQLWRMNSQCLSPVNDSWNELKPFLPMQWIFANRAHCEMVDCRQNPFSATKELFSSRNSTLSNHESFSHLSDIFNFHYFYLFSSFNSNLLDIRMPGKQVSQWTVPLLNPVSYSSIIKESINVNYNFVIGSQMEAHHSIFNQTFSPISKSTALHSEDYQGELPMSLGLSTVYDSTKGVTTVFTLDHHGKVLCHKYVLDSQQRHTFPDMVDDHEAVTYLSEVIFKPSEDDLRECVKGGHSKESLCLSDTDLLKINKFLLNEPQNEMFKNSDVFNII